ncbi:dipeptidyl aminopeptidase/acylaminoacyl peptidase [Parabacteroides sp. PF5-5]|uniref:S9 family peptidase n=1 Tax=unclassified Parabacteroides TaxID=2649774 RepID=UPI002475AEF7|nr:MULTISPECIES: S9 family peptidase [unclassified Parabacteroides]MDH6305867.1 dipeptidyl aminopeptidase/acylaminoacyl peptidase [Parabacteroides sp. PH5-39]MDH6317319.1 dipeptidyl aminopeptidase/acylaminoacyl peptidase [Parabacteroides sp. PF5-13]MDH6320527.1 dipeptidyl aminopeptidase/acylaminoacyl peptidase [Parabacteroides sp. PH5-13]MDH6324310.1 dipeptidyl aminopeptidase/acylaminoacyl peptidase [Parabacteroides sp. PH5-8]MDH6328507.1 dipeptidyl aminopeptidase/acylaminoacyl peptidase [Para
MNKTFFFMVISASVLLGACTHEVKKTENTSPLIGRTEIKVSNGLMTPEVLYSLARVSDAKLSPDGSKVLYGVSFFSIEQNRGNRELFVMNYDGTAKKQITETPKSEQNAVWLKNGNEIAFLSSESGNSQVWIMNADGTNRRRVSNYEGGINGFILSPDETKILFVSDIKYGKRVVDMYPDLPQATGRVVDDLMYKHWDEWVETIPHPFVASFDGKMMGEALDIMQGEPYECPMKPHNGIEDLAWSPDGNLIAYASRKKTGLEYSLSTNSDIYIYNIATKETRNLTEGMMGYDTHPSFSPDGSSIAWISQERDGYESDKKRLFIVNLSSGEKQYLTSAFDYNVDDFQWLPDSKSLYFIACKEALTHIWQIGLDKQIRQITTGQYDYTSMDAVAGNMIATRHSMERPAEIYAINAQSGEATEISFENKATLDQLAVGKSEPRWIKTSDGKQMLTWIVYPPNFDPTKKYPTLLYCQGGPQNTVSQFWSYRWNLQIMAANGYIIVAPNRRGLPGFGQEWLEQISGDYGGQNMKDYFAAIDEMAKEPYVDEERLGAVGASYGGFSVYWLAGHHQKRFKAFIAHAGIFNLEQQYLETEELWFANWDMGGAYWDKSNAIAQKTFANSPHLFVDKWDTPILVTHGELDYRILASQGMSAFNAAKLRGIPTEMLVFPDENHWVLQPQNGVLFQRVFFNWLDKWLK